MKKNHDSRNKKGGVSGSIVKEKQFWAPNLDTTMPGCKTTWLDNWDILVGEAKIQSLMTTSLGISK